MRGRPLTISSQYKVAFGLSIPLPGG